MKKSSLNKKLKFPMNLKKMKIENKEEGFANIVVSLQICLFI